MRLIKKYFSCAAALVLAAACMLQPVHAASNADAILNALQEGITVKGQTVEIPASYVNQAENYFASHKISDAQARYILAEINGAKAAIQGAGVTNLKKMDKETKRKVLASAQAAANNLDLKMTVGSDKNVQIADSSGAVTFTSDDVIKTTGLNWNWRLWAAGWAGALTGAIGVCFLLARKLKFFGAE